MATTLINPSTSQSAASTTHEAAQARTSAFAVELPDGLTSEFCSEEEIREAILGGEIPKTSIIRKNGAATGGNSQTVEAWAKAGSKLRSVYAPVWALTCKGAFVGFLVVGALKILDTLVTLFIVNPGAAVVWLLFGAGVFSPKWKLQLMAAAIFISFKSGINFGFLFGAWFGVAAFAAVFGISAGMVVGTVIGYLKARKAPKAPDAEPEGRKPLMLGLANHQPCISISSMRRMGGRPPSKGILFAKSMSMSCYRWSEKHNIQRAFSGRQRKMLLTSSTS